MQTIDDLQVGDLVRVKATWTKTIGILVQCTVAVGPDRHWWVQWNDGTRGLHHETDLRLVCK